MGQGLVFLTNFALPALTIACSTSAAGKWSVFKWTGQHLRIKHLRHLDNAVKTCILDLFVFT